MKEKQALYQYPWMIKKELARYVKIYFSEIKRKKEEILLNKHILKYIFEIIFCHIDLVYMNQSFREINRISYILWILSTSDSIEIGTLLLTIESSNLALFQITRSIQSNFICISCLKCVSALYHVSD